ncbi:MAG: hypothetical protein H6721_26185 [Sandaracinus sp.]|nr:hypothetical protein [Sandaracinus sp.]MCB9622584.1 hypothetical protein [Sandaracinus sp.]MCB9635624.1 hypothetical protein [Sandaracinus sp.]
MESAIDAEAYYRSAPTSRAEVARTLHAVTSSSPIDPDAAITPTTPDRLGRRRHVELAHRP